MEQLPFIKMHGLGNDFVIIDGRERLPKLPPETLRAIGDRHRGVGYDQLIVLEPSTQADVFMRIYNSNGTEAEACGNATRCVAHLMMEEFVKDKIVIETVAGLLSGSRFLSSDIYINMGKPKTNWQNIPLAREEDTLHVNIEAGPLSDPVAVNMGNPHLVFFVDDAETVDLKKWALSLNMIRSYPKKPISVSRALCRTAISACGCGNAALALHLPVDQRPVQLL